MEYSIGETIMVDFLILNTKSLPFSNYGEIKERIKFINEIIKYSEKKKFYNKLRLFGEIKNLEFLPGKRLTQMWNDEIFKEEKELKDILISLLTSYIDEIPEIEETSEIDYGLIEYKYNDESNLEMGYADIFKTFIVSFYSNKCWDIPNLELKKIQLFKDDGNLKETNVLVPHASKKEHLEENKEILLNKENEIIQEIYEKFPKEKEKYFSSIQFCKEIDKLEAKDIDARVLRAAIKILYDLETGNKNIDDYTYSGESRTVRRDPDLKELRKFTLPSGEKEYIYCHIKNLPFNNRIYFLKNIDEQITIGYIGKHLKTKED